MKKLPLTEFKPATGALSEYQTKQLESACRLAMTVRNFHPCTVMVLGEEYDGAFHFERAEVKLEHDFLYLDIAIDHKMKYHIVCSFNLPNVGYYSRRDVEEKLEAPNNIGVLSTKKIDDWVSYYEKVYAGLKEKSDANAFRESKFRDSIKNLPVKWYDKKHGYVVRNGVKYEFTIEETHISERVELDYSVPNSLQSFLELSENKFKNTGSNTL